MIVFMMGVSMRMRVSIRTGRGSCRSASRFTWMSTAGLAQCDSSPQVAR